MVKVQRPLKYYVTGFFLTSLINKNGPSLPKIALYGKYEVQNDIPDLLRNDYFVFVFPVHIPDGPKHLV